MGEKKSMSGAERVERFDALLVERGGKRTKIRLTPEAVSAADQLITAGAATNTTALVNKLLIKAAEGLR